MVEGERTMGQGLALSPRAGPAEEGKTPARPPKAVIVELTLNFFQAEIDQMAQDAAR